jgi:hypothetical protein
MTKVKGAGPEGHSSLANLVGLKPHASTLFSLASAFILDDNGAGPEGHSSLADFVGLKPHASTVILDSRGLPRLFSLASAFIPR